MKSIFIKKNLIEKLFCLIARFIYLKKCRSSEKKNSFMNEIFSKSAVNGMLVLFSTHQDLPHAECRWCASSPTRVIIPGGRRGLRTSFYLDTIAVSGWYLAVSASLIYIFTRIMFPLWAAAFHSGTAECLVNEELAERGSPKLRQRSRTVWSSVRFRGNHERFAIEWKSYEKSTISSILKKLLFSTFFIQYRYWLYWFI